MVKNEEKNLLCFEENKANSQNRLTPVSSQSNMAQIQFHEVQSSQTTSLNL